MMKYYKDNESNVFAYDNEQIEKVELIDFLERKLSEAGEDSEEFERVTSELSTIPPVFFDIRDKINSMTEMSNEEIELHINPPTSKEQHIAEAETKKQSLLAEATKAIAPLQDAMDLDMATEEETASLQEWKKYRVLLNRIDTSTAPDIEFPEKPQ